MIESIITLLFTLYLLESIKIIIFIVEAQDQVIYKNYALSGSVELSPGYKTHSNVRQTDYSTSRVEGIPASSGRS